MERLLYCNRRPAGEHGRESRTPFCSHAVYVQNEAGLSFTPIATTCVHQIWILSFTTTHGTDTVLPERCKTNNNPFAVMRKIIGNGCLLRNVNKLRRNVRAGNQQFSIIYLVSTKLIMFILFELHLISLFLSLGYYKWPLCITGKIKRQIIQYCIQLISQILL